MITRRATIGFEADIVHLTTDEKLKARSQKLDTTGFSMWSPTRTSRSSESVPHKDGPTVQVVESRVRKRSLCEHELTWSKSLRPRNNLRLKRTKFSQRNSSDINGSTPKPALLQGEIPIHCRVCMQSSVGRKKNSEQSERNTQIAKHLV